MMSKQTSTQLFSSDNGSAVDPRVLEALINVDRDHVHAYGDDDLTRAAEAQIQALFASDCRVFFVYNGTGANVISLASATRSHEAVLCTGMAHINEDECGAPEKFGGFKLHGVPAPDGKMRVDQLRPFLDSVGFEHTNQPRTISITQATEIGTVYRPEEIAEISAFARENGLYLHMDGARISNAAVFLAQNGTAPARVGAVEALRQVTTDAGVDILSFGATKNGLMFGEAIVVFRPELAQQMQYIRKQATQLHSKMRYTAAQFLVWARDGIWAENAARANRLAVTLGRELEGIPGVSLAGPVEANGVFVRLPAHTIAPLQEEFGFYLWNRDQNMARLMVSYDTEEVRIGRFVERLKSLM